MWVDRIEGFESREEGAKEEETGGGDGAVWRDGFVGAMVDECFGHNNIPPLIANIIKKNSVMVCLLKVVSDGDVGVGNKSRHGPGRRVGDANRGFHGDGFGWMDELPWIRKTQTNA